MILVSATVMVVVWASSVLYRRKITRAHFMAEDLSPGRRMFGMVRFGYTVGFRVGVQRLLAVVWVFVSFVDG